MDSIKLMEDLSNAFGVSGFETEISNVLREKMVRSAAIMSAYEESKNKAKRMLQDRKDEVKEK